ncbi:hypothetical protein D9M70_538680 [compost metagenome]
MIAEVLNEPFLLVKRQGDALVVVVPKTPVELHGNLVEGQQSGSLGRDSTTSPSVGVQHAHRIVPACVNRAMNDEAGRVDLVWRRIDGLSCQVDLNQAGCGDLVEHEPVWVDQEMMFRPRQTHRNVGKGQICHAEVSDEPVAGCQLFSQHPFLCRAIFA